jgi:hypothetical protein
MEADTGVICQGNGRIGHWFTYNGTSGDTQTPPPTTVPTPPSKIQPPRGNSTYAMYMDGMFSQYGGIGCSLNGSINNAVEVPRPYDVSGYIGITFFAKGVPSSLRVYVNTTETTLSTMGGTCTGTLCQGNSAPFTLAPDTWTQFTVPFSTLANGIAGFNPQHVLTITFQVGRTAPMYADYWIDDLYFY